MNNRIKQGYQVRVSEGSGLDSRREGRVVSPRLLRTDNRGIPTNAGEGCYKQPDFTNESLIKDLNGTLFLMFDSRLTPLINYVQPRRLRIKPAQKWTL